jgi:hypothetical protein
MNINYYNINKELNNIKKEIKTLKTQSKLVNTKDDIDNLIISKIDELFINNNSITKLNLDILKIKMSLTNIENDISIFKEKTLSKDKNVLNPKFINFLYKNNYYDLEIMEKMGCQNIEDLLLLTEDELIKYGVTIINAKKLLKEAKSYIESNAFCINYV